MGGRVGKGNRTNLPIHSGLTCWCYIMSPKIAINDSEQTFLRHKEVSEPEKFNFAYLKYQLLDFCLHPNSLCSPPLFHLQQCNKKREEEEEREAGPGPKTDPPDRSGSSKQFWCSSRVANLLAHTKAKPKV